MGGGTLRLSGPACKDPEDVCARGGHRPPKDGEPG